MNAPIAKDPVAAALVASLSHVDVGLILSGLRSVETKMLMTTEPNQPARKQATALIVRLQAFDAYLVARGETAADLKPPTATRAAVLLLQRARDLLKVAGSERATERVRHALKSAEGAVRHADGMASR